MNIVCKNRNLFFVLALTVLPVTACHSDSAVDIDASEVNKSFDVPLGKQLAITLQTIGPGEFATPELSSQSVQFLGVEYGNPVPAGPTQIFTFAAVSRGKSVVVFRHTASNRIVKDTVVVK